MHFKVFQTSVICSIPSTYPSRVDSQIPSLTEEANALANAYFSKSLLVDSLPSKTFPRTNRVNLGKTAS